MTEYILTFFSIYFLTLFKFIAGPVLGHAAGFSLLEIMAVTVLGMMSSVLLFTFLGEWIKREWGMRVQKKKVLFSRKSRRLVTIWQKFGPAGVAFLTPLLLTPIGGTVVLTTFGVKKKKIISYMLISGIWWSFVFGLSIERILEIEYFKKLLM
jgi:uncharacterized membrane protein